MASYAIVSDKKPEKEGDVSDMLFLVLAEASLQNMTTTLCLWCARTVKDIKSMTKLESKSMYNALLSQGVSHSSLKTFKRSLADSKRNVSGFTHEDTLPRDWLTHADFDMTPSSYVTPAWSCRIIVPLKPNNQPRYFDMWTSQTICRN